VRHPSSSASGYVLLPCAACKKSFPMRARSPASTSTLRRRILGLPSP